jgi:Ca2+-binding RTX toxin-like protein
MSRQEKTALDLSDLEQVTGAAAPKEPDASATGVQWGSAGDDFQTGSDQADTIHGRDGNDQIYGREGADLVFGGNGQDTLMSTYWHGAGDTLAGGAGDDLIIVNTVPGLHEAHGGAGQDRLMLVTTEVYREDILAGMSIDGAMFLVMHHTDDGVSFTDRAGNPVAVSGTFSFGGCTLRFTGMESISFPTAPWRHA